MSTERPQPTTSPNDAAQPAPIISLHDPRAIQILSTEHWSALTARSLAYNEAFVRAGMFLTFLSTSLIALALLADAMSFSTRFLTVAAIILAFDFVIGLTTFGRISGANVDDLRAMHGMARIRHGYVQAAPLVRPYFTSAIHDDPQSVVAGYGVSASGGTVAGILYGLTTSIGMIGLIVAMVGGVLAGVLAMLAGVGADAVLWIALIGALVVFVALVAFVMRQVPGHWAQLDVRFPAVRDDTPSDPGDGGR
jgi:hypothetical protein